MNNNKLLNDLVKMFQNQFEENNVIKTELEELKKANAHLVKEVEKCSTPAAKYSRDDILSTVKEVKKSIQDGLSKVSNSIANSPSVNKPLSYSAVTKGATSVMFVKPKNQSQTSDQTKNVLRETIDTTKFPIQSVRNANNGGIVIECNNKETIAQLKADTENQLGASYDITAPPATCPKIKIIGIADDLDEDKIMSALVDQNEAIFRLPGTEDRPKIQNKKFDRGKARGKRNPLQEINGSSTSHGWLGHLCRLRVIWCDKMLQVLRISPFG